MKIMVQRLCKNRTQKYESNAHAGPLPIYVADKKVKVFFTASNFKRKILNPIYQQLVFLSFGSKRPKKRG